MKNLFLFFSGIDNQFIKILLYMLFVENPTLNLFDKSKFAQWQNVIMFILLNMAFMVILI